MSKLKEELKTIESFLSNLSSEDLMEMLKRNGYKEDSEAKEELTNYFYYLKSKVKQLEDKLRWRDGNELPDDDKRIFIIDISSLDIDLNNLTVDDIYTGQYSRIWNSYSVDVYDMGWQLEPERVKWLPIPEVKE